MEKRELLGLNKILFFLQLALPTLLVQLKPLHHAQVGHHHESVVAHEAQVGLHLGSVLIDLVVAVTVLGVEVGEDALHEEEHGFGVFFVSLRCLVVVSLFLSDGMSTSPSVGLTQKMWMLQESEVTANQSALRLKTRL